MAQFLKFKINFKMEFLIFLVMISSSPTSQASVSIKVGALFHEGDKLYEDIFDRALSDLNLEYEGAYTFVGVKKQNVERLPVNTLDATCELLQKGSSVIFGPWDLEMRLITANVAQKYNVPHVFYSFMIEDEEIEPSSIRFNAYPSSHSLGKLISEAEKMMSWQSYAFVYQTNEALSRIIQTLPKFPDLQRIVAFRELVPYSEIEELPDSEVEEIYKSLVKDLQKGGYFTLLIDVQPINVRKLLLTMKKMGLMGDYFMALLTSLDISLLEMGDINTKDTVANITYFKLIKESTYFRTVEEAVLYDAVIAYGAAIDALAKHTGNRKLNEVLNGPAVTCHGDISFELGQNIADMYRRKTKFGRYTGFMKFNEEGDREFEVDMLTAQGGRTNIIGTWKNNQLVTFRNDNDLNDTLTEAAKSKIFKVVTRIGGPYVVPVDEAGLAAGRGRLIGERRFEGYCIDLIAKIEEHLGIKCDFYIVPDGNYGSRDARTKKWNGLIKELLELKADFGICDLTITSERQSAVDFTAPFMNLGISILFSKSEKEKPALFAFMSPLSTEVWMYMATAYLIVSLMLFFQAQMAPDEWVNPHPCKEPEELENNFTLTNSFWLTIGSLMQQGSDILPRASSIRVITTMWWFFVLIMVSSYTANLAAFLTATKMEDSINDINDLAKQTKISYGSVMNASTYSFFKNSNTSLYQRIFNTMTDAKPSVFVKTNDEGVDRVIKGKRKYAFFMESTGIEYQVERHCELTQVGNLLDNKGYGIAMPPNSPYRTMVSTAILYLQEKGELQALKNKWWKEMGGGVCDSTSDEPANSNELGMPHVGGIFLVLMCGCLVSILIAILEFVWNIRKVAIERKIPPWEAMKDELKFALNFKLETKPVLSSSSEGSSSCSEKDLSGKSSKDDSKESKNSSKSSSTKNLSKDP